MRTDGHSAPQNNRTPTPHEIEAARLILARMNIDPADLLNRDQQTDPTPTFSAYIPVVAATLGPGAYRTYRPYWERLEARWGDLTLDQPSPSDIKQLAKEIQANTKVRRSARGGRSAVEHFIAAMRCLYSHAVADGLIHQEEDPSTKVPKPRRLPSVRHALPDERLKQITEIAATTGNDPALDSLLLRFHTETACRRGGALGLRAPHDLDPDQCLVHLREKGSTVRLQPVSPSLMKHLITHIERRPAPAGTPLFRYANGRSITGRRYDYLWTRLGQNLPWVAAQQVSTHWLRYTTLTWVERNFSYAIARAYAGHQNSDTTTGATATYVRATIREVATALAAMVDEPHPLANPDR